MRNVFIDRGTDLAILKSLPKEHLEAAGIDLEALEKSRSKEEWKEVKERKAKEYAGETFADPEHDSYPLTENGQPSEERVMAAWRYINEEKNASKYADGGAAVKRRIRAFAKKHFGKDLQEGGDE